MSITLAMVLMALRKKGFGCDIAVNCYGEFVYPLEDKLCQHLGIIWTPDLTKYLEGQSEETISKLMELMEGK